jgi:precorrin-2 methylase
MGLLEHCTTVSRCGLKDEDVVKGFMEVGDSKDGYLSLVLLKK